MTLFVYPVLSASLALTEHVFGIWVGIATFGTGPVTTAGSILSETAGEQPVVTKLTRNLLLGVLVGIYSLVYADTSEADGGGRRTLWESLPKFVISFVALMLLTPTLLISAVATGRLAKVCRWLFLLGFSDAAYHQHSDIICVAAVLSA